MKLEENFISEQKEKLLKEKMRVERELKSFARPSSGNPENYNAEYQDIGDDIDANATEVYTYETNLALEHGLEDMLQKINRALAAIEKGQYGKCEKGDDIEPQRLAAIPWATTCIKHSK